MPKQNVCTAIVAYLRRNIAKKRGRIVEDQWTLLLSLKKSHKVLSLFLVSWITMMLQVSMIDVKRYVTNGTAWEHSLRKGERHWR